MRTITYITYMHAPGLGQRQGYNEPLRGYPSVQSCTDIPNTCVYMERASCMIRSDEAAAGRQRMV